MDTYFLDIFFIIIVSLTPVLPLIIIFGMLIILLIGGLVLSYNTLTDLNSEYQFKPIKKQKCKKNIIADNPSLISENHSTEGPDDIIINDFVENYDKPIKTPYIIGICGASGSGKSFIANMIVKTIKKLFPNSDCKNIVVISQDSYYKKGNSQTNFDVPESIDFGLLQEHLINLIQGKSIERPIYDFSTHSREKETQKIFPGKIIIVEGILIFTQEKLRDLFNMKIFIGAEEPTQIFRRAMRDINERGRTIEEVKQRFERDVWPSYKEHVLPSSKHADILINNFNDCFVGPQIVLSHIITILKNICND